MIRRALAIVAAILLCVAPATAADKKPLVLSPTTGQPQQIQSADTALVPALKVSGQAGGGTQCAEFDNLGNVLGTGGACGGSPGGSSGQVQCNSSGAFAGIAATATQILIAQSSGCPLGKTVSGDATLSAAGALTVTTLNGVSPGYFFNGTDASNLTGTVSAARIAAGSLSLAKLANASANSVLLGSGASGSGSPYVELTLGANLSISGTTLNASGAGGGTGLFGQVLSATPTQSLTGLSNFMTASSADNSTGQTITGGGAYTTSVPGTPYSIVALIAKDGTNVPAIGWTDGTKIQFMYTTSAGAITVQSNSNITSFGATDYTGSAGQVGSATLIWCKIRDDGTNISFSYSNSVSAWTTVYTIAKASGYLGSSGYSHIFVGAPGSTASTQLTTIMSWTQGP